MAENSEKWKKTILAYRTYIRLEKNLAANSVEAYVRDLTEFSHFILRMYDVPPTKVEQVMVERYMLFLYERQRKKSSQARELSSIKGFYNYRDIYIRIQIAVRAHKEFIQEKTGDFAPFLDLFQKTKTKNGYPMSERKNEEIQLLIKFFELSKNQLSKKDAENYLYLPFIDSQISRIEDFLKNSVQEQISEEDAIYRLYSEERQCYYNKSIILLALGLWPRYRSLTAMLETEIFLNKVHSILERF